MALTSLFLPRTAECSAEWSEGRATLLGDSCGDLEATTGFEPVNRGFAAFRYARTPARMTHMTSPGNACSAEQTAESRYNRHVGSSDETHIIGDRAVLPARPRLGGAARNYIALLDHHRTEFHQDRCPERGNFPLWYEHKAQSWERVEAALDRLRAALVVE